MKGWGPVSLSALTQLAYFSHTLKKWNRSLKPPFITILELQILNSTKKNVKKKHHHRSYYHHHPNHHYLPHHPYLLALWSRPCSRSFRMKKTQHIHHRHHLNHHHYHNHHHHRHNHHCHSFSSPLWCRLYLRSFGRMISNFPSSWLVIFQHKIDFQIKRLSYFLKNLQKNYSFLCWADQATVQSGGLVGGGSRINGATSLSF